MNISDASIIYISQHFTPFAWFVGTALCILICYRIYHDHLVGVHKNLENEKLRLENEKLKKELSTHD